MEEIRKPSEWRDMLLQYRLNELDEVAREEVDTRLITDEDFADAMQGAEYDLLDAYAAGELNSRDRLRVEQALQPAGRFSPQAPAGIIEPAHVAQAPRKVALATPAVALQRKPHRLWLPLLAFAAVVLVAAVLFSNLRHGNMPAEKTSARQIPAQAPLANSSPGATPKADVPVITMHATADAPESVAILVLPGALRSSASLHLSVAKSVKIVRFVWPLSDPATTTGYELQVITDDGALRCRSHGTFSRAHGGAVSFTCPAKEVPSGASFARVIALSAAADDTPLLEVSLAVAKP